MGIPFDRDHRERSVANASSAVISGLGVVSPLGIGAEAFWGALCSAKTAIAEIRRFDPGPEPPRLGAEVATVPARETLPAAIVRRMDRLAQMIAVAAVLAVTDAGIAANDTEAEDLGVVVGSELGNLTEAAQFLDRVFTKGPSLANPMLFPNLVLNAPASEVAMALLWRGPNLTVSCGEISAEVALECAVDLVRRGRARAVVVAAGEELSEVAFQALKEFRYLSPRRGVRERSSPFDRAANGPVAGEGASAVVVETRASAAARGAKIRATIERIDRFHLASASPHLWPAADTPEARTASRSTADLVISGADSSPERDALESALISRRIEPGRPVYSLAGAVGSHACQGLSNVVAATLALSTETLPPIVGLETPGFPLSFPMKPLDGAFSRALVVGVARGGGGATIELGREVA
jgi:3-oxoacyl-[acyl-carrier-protein] synthase II